MILESVFESEVFGMLSVDITSPDEVVKKLQVFTPIFKKIEVEAEMVNEKMRNGKFPREANTMVFHAEKILLTTNLLGFFLKFGLKGELTQNIIY